MSRKKSPARKRSTKVVTKMAKAVKVMERDYFTKHLSRAECIAALIAEAKLTKGGAPTYYQLIRKRIDKDEHA